MALAMRDMIGGSMFTNRASTQADLIGDLRAEVHRYAAKVEGLERDLESERRARVVAEMKLAAARSASARLSTSHVPSGDERRGYSCGACGCEFDAPFEDNYCTCCGAQADWRTRNDQMEDAPQVDYRGMYDCMRDCLVDQAL